MHVECRLSFSEPRLCPVFFPVEMAINLQCHRSLSSCLVFNSQLHKATPSSSTFVSPLPTSQGERRARRDQHHLPPLPWNPSPKRTFLYTNVAEREMMHTSLAACSSID
jgi:hypothetical protein